MPTLSIRSRLLLVVLLSSALALVPAVLWGWSLASELGELESESQALPVNRAWQKVISGVQRHRELAAAATTRPDRSGERDAQAAAVQQAFDTVIALLRTGRGESPEVQAGLKLKDSFGQLAGFSARVNGTQAAGLMAGHRELIDSLLSSVTRYNSKAHLLQHQDLAAQHNIQAAIVWAPQVSDALSELAAIGNAAWVDDVGLVSAAYARFEAASNAMRLNLLLAQSARPAEGAAANDVIQQSQEQATLVKDLLKAVNQDPNYELDRFSAILVRAQELQGRLSSRMLDTLQLEMESQRVRSRANGLTVLALLVAGLAAVGVLVWRIIASVLRSVGDAVVATERIADGDLQTEVPTGNDDELQRVLAGLSRMRQRLHQMVTEIQSAASEMQSGSKEIAEGNLHLSQRTERTAASLQQAASSVADVERGVQNTAQTAQAARDKANGAVASAREGGDIVQGVVIAMADIHQRSRRIAEITNVIDSIAFQTNLLALNAAVEAARAGEQGRGFAVVAGEVRQLSHRAAQSAKEIKELINASVDRISQGSSEAESAGKAMGNIVTGINELSRVMDELSNAASEQSSGMASVTVSVQHVDTMTQENSALVEESAAAASSMSQLAARVMELVGSFRVRSGHN